MKRLIVVILILVFLNSVPFAFAENPVDPYESKMELHVYSPCKVKLGFDYTTNMSVSDVTSLGPSLYTIVSSPFDVSFEATDLDTFSYEVSLGYSTVVIQSMTLAIFSGTVPPQQITLPVKASIVNIKFVVTVMKQPAYPTTDEILDSIFPHFKTELQIYHGENAKIVEGLGTTIAYMYYLVAAEAIGLIILAGVVLTALRRR